MQAKQSSEQFNSFCTSLMAAELVLTIIIFNVPNPKTSTFCFFLKNEKNKSQKSVRKGIRLNEENEKRKALQ